MSTKLLEFIAKNCPHLKKFISTAERVFRFSLRELREFSQHFGQTLVYIRFDNLNVQQLTDLLRPMKSLKYIHYYNSYFTIEATNKLLENLSQNLFNIEGIDLQTFYFEIIHSLEDNNCRKFKKISLHFNGDQMSIDQL